MQIDTILAGKGYGRNTANLINPLNDGQNFEWTDYTGVKRDFTASRDENGTLVGFFVKNTTYVEPLVSYMPAT
jgi:lysine/ornithine N-monooxygenase